MVLDSGLLEDAKEKADRGSSRSEQFIAENKDEITALQVLFTSPTRSGPLRGHQGARRSDPATAAVVDARAAVGAYETLDRSKVERVGELGS